MDVTKTGKWMERKRRKKNRLFAKKMGWENKSKILTQRSSGESSLDPNIPRRLQEPPIGPQVPPERPYMTN